MESTWLDRAITWASPRRGAARTAARLTQANLSLQLRAYDGASQGRRTRGWLAAGGSAATETGFALHTLRNRSRDLVRNNEWAASAVESVVANWIGTGIVPKFLGADGKTHDVLTDLWRAWGETTECDAAGMHDFSGLQSLAARTCTESGEVLVVQRFRETSLGNPVNMQLAVLEPDHLDTGRDGLVNNVDGSRLIQGVEYDKWGTRTAYWLFPVHPGDGLLGGSQSVRVPAGRVRHMFRCDRPGQVRGVPWLAPAMIKLRGLDEYQDARMMRERIAACFVGFVEDITGVAGGVPNVGLPVPAAEAVAGETNVRKFEPGLWQPVPAGKKITFGNPPQVEGYREFVNISLRAVAAAIGTTYEELTGDLTQVNFSSGRMGRLAFHRRVDRWQRLVMRPQFNGPLVGWFRNAAAASGLIGQEDTTHVVEWTPPARPMIDPTKEVPARIAAIQGGLISLQETIRERGRDPDLVLDELQEDVESAEARDLSLTSLEGEPAAAPPAQPAPQPDDGDPDDGEPEDPDEDPDEESEKNPPG